MRLNRSSRGMVGVDITSATVKLIELERHGSGLRVDSYAVRPLQEGAVVERRIRDKSEVVDALRRAVEHGNLKSRRAVVAVPTAAAITRHLSLPAALSDDDIEARIQMESEKYVPFPLNEVAFDFQRLGRHPRYDDQQEILLAACRLQDIDTLTSTLEAAGLEAVAVDVEGFALERACRALQTQYAGGGDETIALVDIGANLCAFHVIRAGRIVYSRDNLYGGRQLTNAISKRYGLSFEAAGRAKKRGGLPDDYRQSVLMPFIDTLIQHIGRSLQLYSTTAGQQEIRHLVLAGGSSALPGFAERLRAQSGLEATLANPFTQMRISSRLDVGALAADAPAMLTACGLAMRVQS
ncbi:type IV pilus assembly protein PilM [Salinicola avicenniae]|uniref:type IV pilus assembly protein PilM n=1 Tax=Salinicola avicenniae TaxID=2916836 RepID=UPI002072FEFA|nr:MULTISPECIES: type IV pilus assembly protein PilM [unclassified Salinicola]